MKASRIGAIAVLAAGIGVLAAGCRERGEQALGTEREGQIAPGVPPGAPPAAPPQGQQYGQPQGQPQGQVGQRPAEQIAQARCDKMQRCGRIGQGQKYATMSTCLSAVTADWREDLNAFECPGGFNVSELNECLAEIRGESCDSWLDRVGSFTACRASDICEQVR